MSNSINNDVSDLTGNAPTLSGERFRKWYRKLIKGRLNPLWRQRIAYLSIHRRIGWLKHPRRFSELMVTRMLFDRSEKIGWTAGKYETKKAISHLPLRSEIIPTLWFGTNPDELTKEDLPAAWIAKPNNAWGSWGLVTGEYKPTGSQLNDIRRALTIDVSLHNADDQWAFTQAEKGILVEPKIGKPDSWPTDYKVYVFNGRAEFVTVIDQREFHQEIDGREMVYKRGFFDRNWNRMDIEASQYGKSKPTLENSARPERLDEMLSDAELIAADFDFLRVDFFDDGEKLWFCEVEPYPGLHHDKWNHRGFDRWMGDLWRGIPVEPWPTR